MTELSGQRIFRPNPLTALFAVRPWMLLATLVAISWLIADLDGSIFVVLVGVLLGLLDSLWHFVRVGRNTVAIADGELVFRRGRRVLANLPITSTTRIRVNDQNSGWLEWISAAYTDFALIGVSGERTEMEFLAKTRNQVLRLIEELRQAVDGEKMR